MKKKIMGGYYNFTIQNTNNTKNMKFISSDSSIIFFNDSKNTFEATYNNVKMTKSLSLPFFFKKTKTNTNKKYYILFYSKENKKVYLQILDETDKKFVVEPIITKEDYFFGITSKNRLFQNNGRTFESKYLEWEKELLEALKKREITPEQIHNFLFMKKINTKIINQNSLNAHKLKLQNKRNLGYYNYISLQQSRVPREIYQYWERFYTRHPEYDLRPK